MFETLGGFIRAVQLFPADIESEEVTIPQRGDFAFVLIDCVEVRLQVTVNHPTDSLAARLPRDAPVRFGPDAHI